MPQQRLVQVEEDFPRGYWRVVDLVTRERLFCGLGPSRESAVRWAQAQGYMVSV